MKNFVIKKILKFEWNFEKNIDFPRILCWLYGSARTIFLWLKLRLGPPLLWLLLMTLPNSLRIWELVKSGRLITLPYSKIGSDSDFLITRPYSLISLDADLFITLPYSSIIAAWADRRCGCGCCFSVGVRLIGWNNSNQ